MVTLTLDKSTRALAILAWRKGMTHKRFYSLATMHHLSKVVRIDTRVNRPLLTTKQTVGVRGKR